MKIILKSISICLSILPINEQVLRLIMIEKNIFHEVGKEEEIYPELAEFYNRDFGHTFVCFPWSDIPSILLHSYLQEDMKEKNKVTARPKI